MPIIVNLCPNKGLSGFPQLLLTSLSLSWVDASTRFVV